MAPHRSGNADRSDPNSKESRFSLSESLGRYEVKRTRARPALSQQKSIASSSIQDDKVSNDVDASEPQGNSDDAAPKKRPSPKRGMK